jgi:hypothetical protein
VLSPVVRPAAHGLLRRIVLPVATAALVVGCLSAPAAAAVAPTAPALTPSTTGPVTVGTPMTVAIAPGSAADHVYGYAWTWQSSSNAPVYSSLPACGSAEADGGIHFVCGSSVTVTVSPEDPPFARFTVWAFDAGGNRSAANTVQVDAFDDIAALQTTTHQWSTDQFGGVPAAADCGVGPVTITCVPDAAGIDEQHPNGAHPLLLPPGVTWDGSGSWRGVPGVLTFGAGNRLPAGTLGSVVDTRRSFSAGAWLAPAASPAGAPATAVAQTGVGGTGFELGLAGDGHWQFAVHSASRNAVVRGASPTSGGIPVYVGGVADAVNRELRLYVNGGLAAIAGYAPAKGQAPDGVATVGGRLAHSGLAEAWTGQIGNPVLAPAALTGLDVAQLASETFFWGSGLD